MSVAMSPIRLQPAGCLSPMTEVRIRPHWVNESYLIDKIFQLLSIFGSHLNVVAISVFGVQWIGHTNPNPNDNNSSIPDTFMFYKYIVLDTFYT